MVQKRQLDAATRIMSEFLERTGLDSSRPLTRYLWTDAFAVCNLLAIGREKSDDAYLSLARRLVDQVHHTLGRYRAGDTRKGWLSGLSDSEGEQHPTRGGLRIGKPLPERAPDEPFDEALEWERDGQYFHYLSKWMLALDALARVTGDAKYNTWARELGSTAYRAFTYRSRDGTTRMHWKMSVDLSRPLVASMGQHDPLDGYVTYSELAKTASKLAGAPREPQLGDAIRSFRSMILAEHLVSDDPLGLGGLLVDAKRAYELEKAGARIERGLFDRLIDAASRGLEIYVAERPFERPAERRLAFRELGLAIGLSAVEQIGAHDRTQKLAPHLALAHRITRFWSAPANQSASTWSEHRDINEVMLASALLGQGC